MRGRNWIIAAALGVAAWGVIMVTPPQKAREEPFVVPMIQGAEASGRDLSITVLDVVRTERVEGTSPDGDRWWAEGNWIVVDLEAEARTGAATGLYTVYLVVDDTYYRASERPASLRGQSLIAGMPKVGSVAFELPPSLTSGEARISFAVSYDEDTRGDSLLELTVNLDDLVPVESRPLRVTTWAADQ